MKEGKLRIEYPVAFYHVINRGNFRSWIFETEVKLWLQKLENHGKLD
jgi:hypothetical protein